ncbi:hypothetical protein [Streptomyces sp. NPDC001436]
MADYTDAESLVEFLVWPGHDFTRPERHAYSVYLGDVLAIVAGIGPVYPMPAERVVLLALLAARNAAIEGDVEAIDAFARHWLRIVQPERWRDAVVDALLGDWVHQLGRYLTDPELIRIVHEYTAAENRRWQPLWERKAKGGRVCLSSTLIAEGITLEDTFTTHQTTEELALHSLLGHEGVRSALRGLHPDERTVAAYWAEGAGTWLEAARAAGLSDAHGDRVRRKLRRLGVRQVERAAAVGVSR